jgi:hypothetical protein
MMIATIKKTASARGLNKINPLRNKLKLKLTPRCRYFFGGVLAGGFVPAGFAGLAVAPLAGGAATPD